MMEWAPEDRNCPVDWQWWSNQEDNQGCSADDHQVQKWSQVILSPDEGFCFSFFFFFNDKTVEAKSNLHQQTDPNACNGLILL